MTWYIAGQLVKLLNVSVIILYYMYLSTCIKYVNKYIYIYNVSNYIVKIKIK